MPPKAITKGKSAERELAKLLGDRLGLELSRNLDQTRDGGYDLIGIPGIALEVKRCEKLAINQWWQQALRQAENAGKTPVLAYRQSRKPWQFVVPLSWITGLSTDETATISLEAFCYLVKAEKLC